MPLTLRPLTLADYEAVDPILSAAYARSTSMLDDLARYYDEFAHRAFVARSPQGSIAGYLIAQAQRLGPWLAETPEAAASLLHQALPLIAGNAQVLVPACNQEARILLEHAGFTPGKRWRAMRRGGAPDLQRRQWLYGYANFYVG
jgi:hypothetical protein